MNLYDYFRSSACYRVRIALNIKKIAYEKIPIHLINEGGEQHHENYHQINPQELVPSLEINQEYLTQSLAIIEYLEECYPNPPLLPSKSIERAKARALALIIGCEIHPLNNLSVLNYLKTSLTEKDVQHWYHHWLKKGFDAFENQLRKLPRENAFCLGSSATVADIFLIPQVYNAHRFEFDMQAYPLINQINAHCLSLEAFQKAAPSLDNI